MVPGIPKCLICSHTPLIISLFVNSHKIVQELYAFHFTWIKDQRVATWNAFCDLSSPVPVSSRQRIYGLVMVKRPLKTEASGEMESVMTMKLSLAHTSQMPLTTLDHRWKIRSGVTNSNKCGLLKKDLVMPGKHLSFSIHNMLCTCYVYVVRSLLNTRWQTMILEWNCINTRNGRTLKRLPGSICFWTFWSGLNASTTYSQRVRFTVK